MTFRIAAREHILLHDNTWLILYELSVINIYSGYFEKLLNGSRSLSGVMQRCF